MALGIADLVYTSQIGLALMRLPAMLAGFLLAVPLSRWIDSRTVRAVVIGFAAFFLLARSCKACSSGCGAGFREQLNTQIS